MKMVPARRLVSEASLLSPSKPANRVRRRAANREAHRGRGEASITATADYSCAVLAMVLPINDPLRFSAARLEG